MVLINFILVLPKTKNRYNIVVTITDKFTKVVKIILGKDTWTAVDWGTVIA
jgi:hypothetical protein